MNSQQPSETAEMEEQLVKRRQGGSLDACIHPLESPRLSVSHTIARCAEGIHSQVEPASSSTQRCLIKVTIVARSGGSDPGSLRMLRQEDQELKDRLRNLARLN